MTSTLRIPLPFRVDPPRPLGTATDTISLEDYGTPIAVLTVAEGTAASLTLTYGLPSGPEVPYMRLEWTLPAGKWSASRGPEGFASGSRFSLYWNGDGSYDGWDWSSNNPPDESNEPEKRPKRKATRTRKPAVEDAP